MEEGGGEVERLREQLGETILEAQEAGGAIRLDVAREGLSAICQCLRDDPALAFDFPADLTAWDTGEQFIVWYRLVSIAHNRTVVLHVTLPHDDPVVDSVTDIWPGMNWHERECFDLYGIIFTGHPDSGDPAFMRILLPEDWEGHPFRKDYTPVFSGDPLHGPQETN